jgi:hypothetical protein
MSDAKPDKAAGREERLAARLRDNLKKRKAQSRARRDASTSDTADAPGPGGLAPGKPVG